VFAAGTGACIPFVAQLPVRPSSVAAGAAFTTTTWVLWRTAMRVRLRVGIVAAYATVAAAAAVVGSVVGVAGCETRCGSVSANTAIAGVLIVALVAVHHAVFAATAGGLRTIRRVWATSTRNGDDVNASQVRGDKQQHRRRELRGNGSHGAGRRRGSRRGRH